MFYFVLFSEWIYIIYYKYTKLVLLNALCNIFVSFILSTSHNIINDNLVIENMPPNIEKIRAPPEYKNQLESLNKNNADIKYFN